LPWFQVTQARLREKWLTARRNIRAGEYPGVQLTGGPLLSLDKQTSSREYAIKLDRFLHGTRGILTKASKAVVKVQGTMLLRKVEE
jgi:hypothetical protein